MRYAVGVAPKYGRSEVMSEAKSLVVWKPWEDLCLDSFSMEAFLELNPEHDYEYAHDLSGRFLGVFREVRA